MKKPIRFSLAQKIESRGPSTTTDGRTVNAYFDTKGDKKWVLKRPGISPLNLAVAITPGVAQGMFTFNSLIYTAIGGFLYQIGVGSGSSSPTTPTNRVVNGAVLNLVTLG